MDEVVKVRLVAKKDFVLGDMFDNEHNVKQGQEFYGEKANLKGLKIVAIRIDGNDMYYFNTWAEEFFEIVELEDDINGNG